MRPESLQNGKPGLALMQQYGLTKVTEFFSSSRGILELNSTATNELRRSPMIEFDNVVTCDGQNEGF